ncbi:hypothetical protein BS78_K020300 [Paspalum vaginatum]|uniref:Uncharacterized protein n=1 Tax=Paspalum vaginatum TaxID=158149 RepID=A0A9W7XDT0_9POAL|nr:hypothetical protein BS78_K020300 [Paspalum vaginatum]
MSSRLVAMIVLLLLVMVAAAVSAPAPSTEVSAGERRRPPSLVPFRPAHQSRHGGRQPFFHGRAAGGCMPRFRVPPSAPSRYVNYHTLDAGVCGHSSRGRKP